MTEILTQTGICTDGSGSTVQAISTAFDDNGNIGILCLDGTYHLFQAEVRTDVQANFDKLIPHMVSMQALEAYLVIASIFLFIVIFYKYAKATFIAGRDIARGSNNVSNRGKGGRV